MQVHCGSRPFEGDVGVDNGRRLPPVPEVEFILPLPPRLPPAEPPPLSKPRPGTTVPPRVAVLSNLREYEELAFRENLNAGD